MGDERAPQGGDGGTPPASADGRRVLDSGTGDRDASGSRLGGNLGSESRRRFLGRGAVEMDADLVASALARGFGGMNIVFDRFGFPEDELEKMSNGLVEVLQQAGMA